MFKQYSLFVVALISLLESNAQYTYGTNLPHPNAIMTIQTADSAKGVKMPSVPTIKLPIANNSMKGIVIYDITENCIKVCNGSSWDCIGGNGTDYDWLRLDSTEVDNINRDIFTHGKVGINTTVPTNTLVINGSQVISNVINHGNQVNNLKGNLVLGINDTIDGSSRYSLVVGQRNKVTGINNGNLIVGNDNWSRGNGGQPSIILGQRNDMDANGTDYIFGNDNYTGANGGGNLFLGWRDTIHGGNSSRNLMLGYQNRSDGGSDNVFLGRNLQLKGSGNETRNYLFGRDNIITEGDDNYLLGRNLNCDTVSGCMLLSSGGATLLAKVSNQFSAKFNSGYRFFSNNTMNRGVIIESTGRVIPVTDNTQDLGSISNRWREIFSVNAIINTSDARLKKEILPLSYGLNELMKLKPISYLWKENDNGVRIGFIAQEIKEVIPELIYEGDDDMKTLGVRYNELIPVLTKAIQEQQEMISVLQNEKSRLNTEVSTLKTEIEAIKLMLERVEE